MTIEDGPFGVAQGVGQVYKDGTAVEELFGAECCVWGDENIVIGNVGADDAAGDWKVVTNEGVWDEDTYVAP